MGTQAGLSPGSNTDSLRFGLLLAEPAPNSPEQFGEFIRNELGERDASGRARPVPVKAVPSLNWLLGP